MLLEKVQRRLVSPFRPEVSPIVKQRPVFFLHIPKTAGTSLLHTLVWRFAPDACLHDPQLPTRQELDVNQFQFVSGHANYSLVKKFHQRPFVITFLRDPIDRALSNYFFRRSYTPDMVRDELCQLGEDPNSKWVTGRIRETEILRRLSLRELLRDEPTIAELMVGNAHTRYLSGGMLKGCASERISKAQENLAQCDVIGLTERFAESVDLLSHELGWEPFAEIPRYNVTGKRLASSELDDETRAALTEFLAPDIAVYETAKRLFEQRLSKKRADESRDISQRATPLPDAADFTFAGPVIGAGWYPREKCGSTWSSWSGLSQESWLDLRRPAETKCHLRCELIHRVSPQVLQSVQIRINDHLITLQQRKSESHDLLEGDVPAEAMNANHDRLRIRFNVNNRWRPCDVDPTSNDERWLGINVSRLSLTRAA